MLVRLFLAIASASLVISGAAAAEPQRTRSVVAYDDVRLDVIAEGRGPLVVLLPGRGRDSQDFDALAAGIATAGFRPRHGGSDQA
jgi:hypothetical protein